MNFIVGIFTFILIINCLLLILLVLIQLPKKDAGAGMAFGAGTADALFGAGSGNALTKITKYSAILFFALSLLIGILQDRSHMGNTAAFEKQLQQIQTQTPAATPPSGAQPTAAAPKNNLLSVPLTSDTNTPAASVPAK